MNDPITEVTRNSGPTLGNVLKVSHCTVAPSKSRKRLLVSPPRAVGSLDKNCLRFNPKGRVLTTHYVKQLVLVSSLVLLPSIDVSCTVTLHAQSDDDSSNFFG